MTEHKKTQLLNEILLSKSGLNNYKVFTFDIEHNRKKNHRVKYAFTVEQPDPNTVHKMYCYVFSQKQAAEWFLKNVNYGQTFLSHHLRNLGYTVEKSSDEHEFEIKNSTTLYFVFINWYTLTISKNVKIEIYEEWDEHSTNDELDLFTTIPPYDNSLLTQSQKMIESASENLKIITPYIDMSLISQLLKKFDSGIEVQIITRTRNDFSGKSSKEAFDHLNQKLRNNHKTNSLIHSRIIIKDNSEILVSSSDLTQDSLLGQFNAGIVTMDEKTIQKLSEYFKRVWNSK